MQWRDDALVVACQWHGEHAALLTVLTKQHGLWRGLVHGAHSQKTRALIQLGSPVSVVHRARVAEQLGVFRVDASYDCGFSYRLHRARRLAMLSSSCGLVTLLCPEHQPHEAIFLSLCAFYQSMTSDEAALPHYVAWEYDLLRHLGYGMDISQCALSGARGEVAFVSKKSGRGICAARLQQQWRKHLLAVPPFLAHYAERHTLPDDIIAIDEIEEGLQLTGYFLHQCAAPRTLPASRQWMLHQTRAS